MKIIAIKIKIVRCKNQFLNQIKNSKEICIVKIFKNLFNAYNMFEKSMFYIFEVSSGTALKRSATKP
jgi:hypothetical protein